MTALMTANAILVALNAVLLLLLVVLYGRMLRQVATPLTWGLLAFAGVLLVQNLTQLYFFATMMSYYAGDVEGLVLVQNALETVALVVLAWATFFPGTSRAPAAAAPR